MILIVLHFLGQIKLSIPPVIKIQFAEQVKIRLISQLINGISTVLQIF